ncbi:MAG: hypothetical protein JRN20_00965 [Nitrososphaerota archaeon]|nr:hypothetical protein [Nitrososphaerota archaeon]
MARDRQTIILALIVIAAVVVSGLLGYYISASNSTSHGNSNTQSNVVNLEIIPDYGGSGYDAFVLASNFENGNVPAPATNTTAPGVNNNNITASVGSTVTFVLTNIDTAVNENFSGTLPTPFTVYNDTDSGVIASQYSAGQSTALAMSHTFTITQLGVNVPIPADTVVSFKLTFSKAGTYLYECETPCGPGMGLVGYMSGYVIVK